MENLISADIFFFLTSLAVVACTVCVVIVTAYVVRILKDIKNLSKTVNEEGKKIVTDVEVFRQSVKEKGTMVLGVFNSLLNIFKFGTAKNKNEKRIKTNKKV